MMHCNMLRIKPPTYGQDLVTFSKVFHVEWNSVSLPTETDSNGVIYMIHVCQRLTFSALIGSQGVRTDIELWSGFLSVPFLPDAQTCKCTRWTYCSFKNYSGFSSSSYCISHNKEITQVTLTVWAVVVFALLVTIVSLTALYSLGQ